jgi:hypothetical protein
MLSLIMQVQFIAVVGTVSASLPGGSRAFSSSFDAFNLQVDLFGLFEQDASSARRLGEAEEAEETGILAYCAQKNLSVDGYFLSNLLTAIFFMAVISIGQYLLGVGMRLYYATYSAHTGRSGRGSEGGTEEEEQALHKRKDAVNLYMGVLAYPAPQFAGALLAYQVSGHIRTWCNLE